MQRATRKSSNTRKSRSAENPAAHSANIPQTIPTREECERVIAYLADRPNTTTATESHFAKRQREGVTLKGAQLQQAEGVLDSINLAALSVYRLAISATCESDPTIADAYLTAVHNSAIVICRYADVLASLLEGIGFGNFEDEFVALTPERESALAANRA